MSRPPASATVQVETERVRVTEWRLPPGTATGYHRHALDYVVVPVVPGTLTMVGPDGTETTAALALGQSYARLAGVEHDVVNNTYAEIAFVEIELK
jgi:quercetin dioxygenase-like cupin family protein